MQNGIEANELQNLDLSDVFQMSDDDTLGMIDDIADEIGLNTSGDDAQWSKSDNQVTENGEELNVWTNTDNNATLFIDNDITTDL